MCVCVECSSGSNCKELFLKKNTVMVCINSPLILINVCIVKCKYVCTAKVPGQTEFTTTLQNRIYLSNHHKFTDKNAYARLICKMFSDVFCPFLICILGSKK